MNLGSFVSSPGMSVDQLRARSCGVCRFGQTPRAVPSAATVLAYSCTSFEGAAGVMEYISRVSSSEQIHSATAYCEACHKVTWLCSDSCLNSAVVEFRCNVQRAKAVEEALQTARSSNGV